MESTYYLVYNFLLSLSSNGILKQMDRARGIIVKVAIAGGTGMVGRKFSELLLKSGHKVIVLTRGENHTKNGIQYVKWLTEHAQPELQLEQVDAFINLAGVSLNAGRWTKQQKQKIYTSRMESRERSLSDLMGFVIYGQKFGIICRPAMIACAA